jgi:hypothetical protein
MAEARVASRLAEEKRKRQEAAQVKVEAHTSDEAIAALYRKAEPSLRAQEIRGQNGSQKKQVAADIKKAYGQFAPGSVRLCGGI